jgi:hypothetical protein
MGSQRDMGRWIWELELPAWTDFLDPTERPVVAVDVNPEAAGVEPTRSQLLTLRHFERIQVDLLTLVEARIGMPGAPQSSETRSRVRARTARDRAARCLPPRRAR